MKKWYYKLPLEWVEMLKSKGIDTQPRPTVTLFHANFRGADSLTLQTMLESECIYDLLVYIFCEFCETRSSSFLSRGAYRHPVRTDIHFVKIPF